MKVSTTVLGFNFSIIVLLPASVRPMMRIRISPLPAKFFLTSEGVLPMISKVIVQKMKLWGAKFVCIWINAFYWVPCGTRLLVCDDNATLDRKKS